MNGGSREGPPGPDGARHIGPNDDGKREEWMDPLNLSPENDLALARMLGCAFLFGIACLVGLAVLLF